MSTEDVAAAPGLWRCHATGPDGARLWSAVALSARHPDGALLTLSEQQAVGDLGGDAIGFARYDPDGAIAGLEVTSKLAPDAPPLWWAELGEPSGTPPAITLLAFSDHDVEPGSLLSRTALHETSARSADQRGAVRWYPGTGEVDQIYVAPAWRRRSIASALLVAAGTLNFAQGNPRLWGDGQRTADGDRLRNASQWAHRAAPLTHLAPPMTPFDQRPS